MSASVCVCISLHCASVQVPNEKCAQIRSKWKTENLPTAAATFGNVRVAWSAKLNFHCIFFQAVQNEREKEKFVFLIPSALSHNAPAAAAAAQLWPSLYLKVCCIGWLAGWLVFIGLSVRPPPPPLLSSSSPRSARFCETSRNILTSQVWPTFTLLWSSFPTNEVSQVGTHSMNITLANDKFEICFSLSIGSFLVPCSLCVCSSVLVFAIRFCLSAHYYSSFSSSIYPICW